MERFYEGQKVVCISEDFPQIRTTNKDKSELGQQAIQHPKKGETLVIDEMLGVFLRFDKYDTDSFNWWHNSRFKPLDEFKFSFQEETINANDIRLH
jgi:hypothetical protein